ncbi:MAG TPA: hypothetical protein VHC91_01665 [Trinickia sp.]|jgi:hypothetical protein|uniref:hypothetical protein n=1 Tax=Trinickia sp. TaxID=2571163 RepID=UPI002C0113DA|nr:hypothetical protein [Trinickia sp.]HVW49100.1 hypothetical protein [Trinickia sp.]
MELSSLTLLTAAGLALGAAATYLMAQLLPAPVAEMAARHGRFVGLGEGRQATTPPAPHRRRTQREAMNVVRTAHS